DLAEVAAEQAERTDMAGDDGLRLGGGRTNPDRQGHTDGGENRDQAHAPARSPILHSYSFNCLARAATLVLCRPHPPPMRRAGRGRERVGSTTPPASQESCEPSDA